MSNRYYIGTETEALAGNAIMVLRENDFEPENERQLEDMIHYHHGHVVAELEATHQGATN